MSDEAARYREQAEYCRQQPNKATERREKQAWLKVAGDWLRMAENAELQSQRDESSN